jgi:hypothetical protein
MGLSEILSKAARERAEQQRQLNAGGQWRSTVFGRDKLWDALNAVCEFVPLGSPEFAARKWANLFIAACDQLKAAGEVRRLQAMQYQGPDAVCQAGTEAAYRACEFACAHKRIELSTSLRDLIVNTPKLDNAFRMYLESLRDNRCWWAPPKESRSGRT